MPSSTNQCYPSQDDNKVEEKMNNNNSSTSSSHQSTAHHEFNQNNSSSSSTSSINSSPHNIGTFNPHDVYSKHSNNDVYNSYSTQQSNGEFIPQEKRTIRPPPLSLFLEGADAAEQIQKQLAIKKALDTMTESCVSKSVFAAVAGTILGGAFGIISTSFTLEQTFMKTPQQIIKEEQMTSREKIREYFRETKTKCVTLGKSFGAVGALYSIFECSLEKVRGKKDIKGSLMAGCISGAILARKAGIGAMVFGCATFSAFSGAIDLFTEYN